MGLGVEQFLEFEAQVSAEGGEEAEWEGGIEPVTEQVELMVGVFLAPASVGHAFTADGGESAVIEGHDCCWPAGFRLGEGRGRE